MNTSHTNHKMNTGDNARSFQQAQAEFSAYIRNPLGNAVPLDVEPRRMQIYADLFFRNIESLLASTFPVCKRTLGAQVWPALIHEYVHLHVATTPYFLQLPQEFLEFLGARGARTPHLPAFTLELCHYEWVELALDVAEEEVDAPGVDPDADVCDGVPVWSAVARSLVYAYPVHLIGPDNQPPQPPSEPTCLIVYRNRSDSVKFMATNPVTARLAALIQQQQGVTGRSLVETVADELPAEMRPAALVGGLATLRRLRLADIIAGALHR